jgi:MFS family permease
MCTVPIREDTVVLVTAIVLAANVAATFIAFSVQGLVVHNVPAAERGRVGGFLQTGNQVGQTLGGGLALWLMRHLPSPWMAGAVLASLVAACGLALAHVEEPPRPASGDTIVMRIRGVGREVFALARSRDGWLGLLLAFLPIGTGAAQFLFASIASEWGAGADLVAAVQGMGAGIAIAAGCLAGGWLTDRMPRRRAYVLACAAQLVAAALILVSPRLPVSFAVVSMTYTFTLGLCIGALTGFVLPLAGEGATATTVSLFFAFNTMGGLLLIRAAGAAHDAWGTAGMLGTEIVVGCAALALFAAVATIRVWLVRPGRQA